MTEIQLNISCMKYTDHCNRSRYSYSGDKSSSVHTPTYRLALSRQYNGPTLKEPNFHGIQVMAHGGTGNEGKHVTWRYVYNSSDILHLKQTFSVDYTDIFSSIYMYFSNIDTIYIHNQFWSVKQ